jgi:hypothetical protein
MSTRTSRAPEAQAPAHTSESKPRRTRSPKAQPLAPQVTTAEQAAAIVATIGTEYAGEFQSLASAEQAADQAHAAILAKRGAALKVAVAILTRLTAAGLTVRGPG